MRTKRVPWAVVPILLVALAACSNNDERDRLQTKVDALEGQVEDLRSQVDAASSEQQSLLGCIEEVRSALSAITIEVSALAEPDPFLFLGGQVNRSPCRNGMDASTLKALRSSVASANRMLIAEAHRRMNELFDSVLRSPDKGSEDKGSDCNANYSGCLEADASDYDCSNGDGDGPLYTDEVQVLGYDEYGLDADGDGRGCE